MLRGRFPGVLLDEVVKDTSETCLNHTNLFAETQSQLFAIHDSVVSMLGYRRHIIKYPTVKADS